jgi:predicted porin
MIKKMLPTMIGVALAGGMTAASADVTVFGHIDTSIDYIDAGAGTSDTNLHCTTCSIGFKGSEDLGNGLKAIFSLDFQYDTVNRNNSKTTTTSTTYTTVSSQQITAVTSVKTSAPAITDRDQWLGLSGGFGKVRVGTISTVYKSHGADIDPLYRTALQGRDVGLQSSSFHSGAGEELEGRATNTIRWDSADFNGVKLGATYTLDSSKADGESANPYGLGASYENGGILVFADYMDNNQSGAASDSVWKIGGKYSFNEMAVYGQYEDNSWGNNGGKFQNWFLAGSYTMDSNMLYVGYGNSTDEDNTNGKFEDIAAWTIAGVHNMSKMTSVYLGYNNQDDSKSTYNRDQYSLGMKLKF